MSTAMRLRSLATPALDALRQRFGRYEVNWTPEFMGFGNQLYLWCWAHSGGPGARARQVLITDKMRPWASFVPDFARARLVERQDVGFLDVRGNHWAEPLKHSGDRRGFTEAGRAAFVREALLPEPLLAGIGTGPLSYDDVLVVNARRGDYYSVPAHRSHFAIDLRSYLNLACARSVDSDGPVRRLHVVSDDVEWCRGVGLERYARSVTYAEPGRPVDDFRAVASARRLVISNSTFSMWGAFVATTVHGDTAGQVWAPAFFMSTYGPGRCYEYDTAWGFVDELPDGWQPDWVLAGAGDPRPAGWRPS